MMRIRPDPDSDPEHGQQLLVPCSVYLFLGRTRWCPWWHGGGLTGWLCNCVYGGVKLPPLRVLFSLKYLSLQKPAFPSVLRIHDILVSIRIRIRGSMPLTNGSGSGFFCFLLFEGTFAIHHFSKIKKIKKKSLNSRNQGFSYYFSMMIEGSRSVPLTSRSWSRRPKNIWIWRIRIRNTASLQ